MTRKQLEDLGLSKEQADSVMKINGDDIENAKGSSSAEIQSLKTEVEGLKAQVGDRDKQLDKLKASAGDNESLKAQIEALQADNTTAKKQYESELKQLKVDHAVEKALTGAKAKNTLAVKALLKGLDKAELMEDGTIKGLSEQITALQTSDAYLFDAADKPLQPKGARPGESDSDKRDHNVDTSKMTYTQLAAYMAENPGVQI